MSTDKYLIKSKEISDFEGVSKTHFLNPNAQCVNKSIGDLVGLTGIGVNVMEIEPSHCSTEHHFHYREDECVYIISGEGMAEVGDKVFPISDGDFLGYRKGGLAHSIKNTGSTTLRCLVVGERGDTDVLDYPRQEKRIFRTKGLKWNVVNYGDIEDRKPPEIPNE